MGDLFDDDDPPPPPDYSGLARASEKSAEMAYDLAREQHSWAQKVYAENKAVTDKVVDAFMAYQEENATNARKDRARYEHIFQPLEEDLVEDAEGYTDARNRARGEQAAGKAAADVSQQFRLARSAAQDRLESFGIDPSQTRSGALDVQTRIAEAAARAGQANVAREGTIRAEEATGRALRSEALNVGRGYPGQIAGQYGTALQSGQGAQSAGLAQTASGAQTMGTAQGWQGMGNNAIGQWGNTLNMGYNNQMAGWKADQEQSSGWGQALGMVAGIGAGIAMPGMQTAFSGWFNKAAEGGLIRRYADGGAVDTDASPEGVHIDPGMSPSQGVNTDDVPAMLNADEFVIPADVLKWKGEEFFQKTIQKSREAKEEAPAKPTVMMAGVPVVPQGNPARQALPLG